MLLLSREEGPDDEGKSLVRDCSCRGDSAGFAHLSCLTKYAEQKCRAANYIDLDAFVEPWNKCNNCKQTFQNQLAVDLSSAFVSFAEAIYGHPGNSKWDKLKVISALRTKIMASKPPEREELNNTLSSMIDKTKNELNMSRWVHMPKDSEEYLYYKTLCGNYEAFFYDDLGAILKRAGNPIAIAHFKKARAIVIYLA